MGDSLSLSLSLSHTHIVAEIDSSGRTSTKFRTSLSSRYLVVVVISDESDWEVAA